MRGLGALLVPALAALLAGCAAVDTLVKGASSAAVKKGWMSERQASGFNKTASALRKSAEEISESEEYYIGRAVAAQILSRYKPLHDADLNLYVQKVAQSVSLASERPSVFKGYHVQLLDSSEINAFAAPGGFIFMTKGMLDLLKDEDELACVLAHELAHVTKKHGLKTIQTARLTKAFSILGAEAAKGYTPDQVSQLTSAFEGAIDDVVNKLVVNGYSRDKEFEADHFGSVYARSANYDPAALKNFLARLDRASSKGGIFKTHPAADKRLEELAGHAVNRASTHRASTQRSQRFSGALAAR